MQPGQVGRDYDFFAATAPDLQHPGEDRAGKPRDPLEKDISLERVEDFTVEAGRGISQMNTHGQAILSDGAHLITGASWLAAILVKLLRENQFISPVTPPISWASSRSNGTRTLMALPKFRANDKLGRFG